jgi:hypothetical protein
MLLILYGAWVCCLHSVGSDKRWNSVCTSYIYIYKFWRRHYFICWC